VALGGGKLVEAGYANECSAEQLAAAITPRTAAIPFGRTISLCSIGVTCRFSSSQSLSFTSTAATDWLLENLHVTPIEHNEIVLPKGHNVNFGAPVGTRLGNPCRRAGDHGRPFHVQQPGDVLAGLIHQVFHFISTPRPEVVEAAMAGMNQYFEMKDLVNKTGEYIAFHVQQPGDVLAGLIHQVFHFKVLVHTGHRGFHHFRVSTPRPEVVEAAMAGMNQYFEMKDLVNKTGEYISYRPSRLPPLPGAAWRRPAPSSGRKC
jgi:seryl-tRNA(Sec) selenium transferase